MTFEELLDQAIALLQRRRRLTYRALKRQFNLDDDCFEDLKAELIQGQRLAVDEDGSVLSGRATPCRSWSPQPLRCRPWTPRLYHTLFSLRPPPLSVPHLYPLWQVNAAR